MDAEKISTQRFVRLVGGYLTAVGFQARGDYGDVVLPWQGMGHLFIVNFYKSQRGVTSPLLIILMKQRDAIYYFDGASTNFKELLSQDFTENPDHNMRLLIKKLLFYVFEVNCDASIFEYLKGGMHLIRKFVQLNQLGTYCDEMRGRKVAQNQDFDSSLLEIIKDFSLHDRLDACRSCRKESFHTFRGGFELLTGKRFAEEKGEASVKELNRHFDRPEDYFSAAMELDPHFHLPHAGMALRDIMAGDLTGAIEKCERALNLLPYPHGIPEAQGIVYLTLFEQMMVYMDDERFLQAFERFLGFSPRSTFRPFIASFYKSRGLSAEWYGEFLTAFYCISQKRYAESLEPIESAMKLYPEFLWSHHWQGVALARMGRANVAWRAFERVVSAAKSANSHVEMYLQKKNREDKTLLDFAMLSNPLSAWPYFLLAEHAYTFLKDDSKGLFYSLSALYLDPTGPFINRILELAAKAQALAAESTSLQRREELKRGDFLAGKYEVTQVFKGGMGIVYIAYDTSSGIHYAVKTFQEQFLWDKSVISMFINEAEVWIRMDAHENVVQAKFIKLIADKPYLFLEYVRGTDLESIISKGALDIKDAVTYAIQFCSGMSHAYNVYGIIHRDIKPSNCLISHDNVLKITDFGLVKIFRERADEELKGTAKALPQDLKLTATDSFLGTIPYMAPERLLFMESGDIRSDIYSFGVMAYEMLGRQLPYGAEALTDNFTVIITEDYIPLHEINKKVPLELSQIIDRCLEKEPDARYRDFDEIKARLLEFYEHHTKKEFVHHEKVTNVSVTELIDKGNSLMSIGKEKQALECFESALVIDPESNDALKGKSVALLKIGRCQEALSSIEILLFKEPGRQDVVRNKGIALMEMGRFNDGLECFDTVIRENPRDAFSWWKKANVYEKLGRNVEALPFYEKALALDPKLIEAWDDQGMLLFRLGRLSDALWSFNSALEINPAYGRSLMNRARALLGSLQFEEAEKSFQMILNMDDRNREALLGLAGIQEKSGRLHEALKTYSRIISTNPQDREALQGGAEAYKRLGFTERALELYELMQLKTDDDPSILLKMATLYKELFYYENARKVFQAVLSARPQEAVALQKLREIEDESTHVADLKNSLIEALAICDLSSDDIESTLASATDPAVIMRIVNVLCDAGVEDPVIYEAKGKARKEAGHLTEALFFTEKALELRPDSRSAAEEKERLVSILQKKKGSLGRGLLKKILAGSEPDAYELFKKGMELFNEGHHRDAISRFDDSLKGDAQNATAWLHVGISLQTLGKLEKALSCFQNALSFDASLSQAWCAKGEIEERLGRSFQTEESYRNSLLLNPLNYRAWINVIACLDEAGERKKARLHAMIALDMIDHALKKDPENIDSQLRKATLEFLLQRYQKATDLCAQFPPGQPGSLDALMTKGLAHRHLGDLQEAMVALNSIVTSYPDNLVARAHRGHTLEMLNELDAALEDYEQILSLRPAHEWALYRKSLLFFRKELPEEGLRCVDSILELNAQSARAWKAKGHFLSSQGKGEEALWCFQRAVENNPRDFYARFNLIILQNRFVRNAEALESLKVLLDVEPYDPDLHILEGDSLEILGKNQEALEAFDRAIALEPHYTRSHVHKALLLNALSRADEALGVINEAIESSPTDSSLWNNMAYILACQERFGDARGCIDKALLFDPKNESLLYNQAVLALHEGRMVEAMKPLDAILYLKSDFVPGWRARGLLCELLKEPQEALNYYDQAMKREPKNADLWLYKGNALFSLKKLDEAVRSYSQAIKLNPSLAQPWLYKAFALEKLQRSIEAEQCLAQYLKLKNAGGLTAEQESAREPAPYATKELFSMVTIRHDFDVLEEPPKILFRDIDFMKGA
jgi:tetratricopeptide (TPR) repeat protein